MYTTTPDAKVSPLVSVIIPIYKVESYLRACVDSVLQQSYQQLEVILVDDGSPDSCGAICDAYAAADPRVVVVHRSNGGLSAARNSGLERATGQFITFVDSDDWVDRETIATYMRLFAEHPELDLIEAGVYFSSLGGNCTVGQELAPTQKYNQILSQRELFEEFCIRVWNGISLPAAWNKCYRRTLIGQQRFREGYIFEDLEFQLRLYARVRYYMHSSRICFYYREQRKDAITERVEAKLIPKFVQSYDNMLHILLDLKAQREQGLSYPEEMISLEEHEAYVATRFMTDLIRPPYVELAKSSVRKQLYKIQAPYFKFLADYPYLAPDPRWQRERALGIRSYTFYMKCYLPSLYAYGKLRRGLARLWKEFTRAKE